MKNNTIIHKKFPIIIQICVFMRIRSNFWADNKKYVIFGTFYLRVFCEKFGSRNMLRPIENNRPI
jgi:hypothetical protein